MTIQEARGASALTTIGTANFHRAMMPTRRCAKALKPMADLSALKEQTWRTASFWHISYLKNAGATNKRIPWGEQVSDFVTNVRQSEVAAYSRSSVPWYNIVQRGNNRKLQL